MKAVILAGGLGTRISEETVVRPKPMVEIGGKPILWHIMKGYSAAGIQEFIVCCGYKGYLIKEYFANYFLHMSDVTFDMRTNSMEVHQKYSEPWRVTLVDTGEQTMTGGRLKRIRDYVGEDFCMTYGDGVSDIDIRALLRCHAQSGRLATITAVQPAGRYGALDVQGDGVAGFVEKPQGDGAWFNGGYFVLSPKALDYVDGDQTIWEREPVVRLSAEGQLGVFRHRGFWQPMDTLRDKILLEDLWQSGEAAVEDVGLNHAFWRGRRVLVTGHTGFKGGWLSLWLQALDAKVSGFALPPPAPSFFETCGVANGMSSQFADLRSAEAVLAAVRGAEPEIVLHLAAQAIVRQSYADPVETYATNVMGTVHLLEAVRRVPGVRAVVVVTSDKCYDNREWPWGYRENDAVGGFDPYASSKGCAELVTAAYRSSYFPAKRHAEHGVAIATARAGNVVGGGDWAADRLVPDCLRALDANTPLKLRFPDAVRPWQHVLDPLAGYLVLAERLHRDGAPYAEAWNFGPAENDARPVRWVVEELAKACGSPMKWEAETLPQPHEANSLRLDCGKARSRLGWQGRWPLHVALEKIGAWHNAFKRGTNMRAFTLGQISEYVSR